MKLPRSAKVFRGQLDAAPFAGVSFLLLIFLVLQSKLVFTPGVRIEIDVPQVAANLPGTDNPTLVVAVDRGGLIYYDGQRTTLADLRHRLRAEVQKAREMPTLEVRQDKAVTWEATAQLLSLAREVGMREALLVTRTRTEPVSNRRRK